MKELELQACVYSRTAPEEAQLRAFLNQKYRRPVRLRWERDERMKDGFRLELGEGESRELVYDWSSAGKSRQLKDRIAAAIRSRSDVIPLLKKTLEECHDILDCREAVGVLFERRHASRKQPFQPEQVPQARYEQFARSMAPLRMEAKGAPALPRSVSFLQGYHVSRPSELALDKNWANAEPERSMAVPIGVRGDGTPFLFDIHEKRHGPHGLVAGTTGSGKSEMVQSWILSMAVRFPPDVVSFVLIDFKGTGLLLPFQNLPHLAGRISDLDTSIGRNLIALEYELTRRKELLDRWKVSNISDYRRLLREGKADEQLGYLFIVIDEFAEFKNRFPEFMQAVNRGWPDAGCPYDPSDAEARRCCRR